MKSIVTIKYIGYNYKRILTLYITQSSANFYRRQEDFNMKLNIPEAYEDLMEQFGIYLTFFHVSGLPVMSYKNIIYYTYALLACFSMIVLLVAILTDMSLHIHDLSHVMDNVRITFALIVSIWIWTLLW